MWDANTTLPLHREICSKAYYDNNDDFKEWVDTVNKEFEEGKCLSRHSFDIPDSGGSTLGPLFELMDRSDAPQRDKLRFHEEVIQVECIDFSAWMKDNLSPDDNIILKMDIEGSEFRVLPKMIDDDTMDYVNALIVEWHDWEFKQLASFKQAIMNVIQTSYDIAYMDWK